MIRENAVKLLHDVHSALTGMGKTHFIIDGTLLGAHREGDFIKHDNDMDMGVLWEEWTPTDVFRLTNEMVKKNIMLKNQFGDFNNFFETSYVRDGIKIDLFFYRRQGDLRIFHAFRNGGKNWNADVITYYYRAEAIEQLHEIQFADGTYPAPVNAEEIIIAKYGPDWRMPKKDWDWADDPQNKLVHSIDSLL